MEIISHWHTLVDDFNTSGLDFYAQVEEAIRTREVPDVEFSRVEYKEGGIGSAKREYLRVARGNVAFDVCAAPYGNAFFFSWWLSRLGPKHPFLYILGFFAAMLIGPAILTIPFQESCGMFLAAPIAFIVTLAGLCYMAREGVFGPEEVLIEIPILGWIYEKLFNPSTFYALDTALMYQESVRRAVNEVIAGLLSAQGLKALKEEDWKPTLRDLAR